MLPLELRRRPDARAAAREVAGASGSPAALGTIAATFRRQQQRRHRARVRHQPDVLFADEPTGNSRNTVTGARIMDLLFGLNTESRTTHLCSSLTTTRLHSLWTCHPP
jgi:predicted ABC-type transport system involved in lysophospholipase L1 biosynthesis ATPase subunit